MTAREICILIGSVATLVGGGAVQQRQASGDMSETVAVLTSVVAQTSEALEECRHGSSETNHQ